MLQSSFIPITVYDFIAPTLNDRFHLPTMLNKKLFTWVK